MNKEIIRLGVIGQSERLWDPLPREIYEISYRIGYLTAKQGWILFSGGRDGVMEAASKGAKDAGGITVGILPSLDKKEANEYIDIPITTGLGIGMRSELMIQTVDCIVMIGGKNGTLKELSAAYMNKKPIVIIRGSGGAADSVGKILFEGKYLDKRRNVDILFADSPKEAIELLVPLVSHK